jgi:hypothetical protein
MCKDMPVILVNKVVDTKKKNWKNWRAEEERHKWSLAKKITLQKVALSVI